MTDGVTLPTGVHSASPRALLRRASKHCAARGVPSVDSEAEPEGGSRFSFESWDRGPSCGGTEIMI